MGPEPWGPAWSWRRTSWRLPAPRRRGAEAGRRGMVHSPEGAALLAALGELIQSPRPPRKAHPKENNSSRWTSRWQSGRKSACSASAAAGSQLTSQEMPARTNCLLGAEGTVLLCWPWLEHTQRRSSGSGGAANKASGRRQRPAQQLGREHRARKVFRESRPMGNHRHIDVTQKQERTIGRYTNVISLYKSTTLFAHA